MASRKDNSCGIEIQKGLITVAQYSAQDNAVGSIVINPFDELEQSGDAALRTELKKITSAIDFKRQSIAVSVPAQFAVIKTIELDGDEHNVSDAIIWELSQQIIGDIEEFSVDFEPLAKQSGSRQQRYLAVAYRSAYIEKLSAILKTYKISPVLVDLDVFALVNVFEANYREHVSSPALLVLGGEEKSDIILTQAGGLVDYDVCIQNAAGISPEEFAGALSDYCLRLAGKWAIAQPQMFCAGPLFSHPEYIDAIKRKFAASLVLDPFRKISCKAANGENYMEKLAPQLAVAVGLALQGASE